jgi:hypothetical protein
MVVAPVDDPNGDRTHPRSLGAPRPGDELRSLVQFQYVVARMFRLLAATDQDRLRAQDYRRWALHALRDAAKAQRIAAVLDLRPRQDPDLPAAGPADQPAR